MQAAEALQAAYGTDIEIRFNSDRESGGAWLKTPDGGNAETGIAASVVTARARARWEASAQRYETEADTGRSSWPHAPKPLTDDQREAGRTLAQHDRALLAECPEGQLTVYAHITARAVQDPDLVPELAALPGWNDRYHHGPADDVQDALARCLRFAPPAEITT